MDSCPKTLSLHNIWFIAHFWQRHFYSMIEWWFKSWILLVHTNPQEFVYWWLHLLPWQPSTSPQLTKVTSPTAELLLAAHLLTRCRHKGWILRVLCRVPFMTSHSDRMGLHPNCAGSRVILHKHVNCDGSWPRWDPVLLMLTFWSASSFCFVYSKIQKVKNINA